MNEVTRRVPDLGSPESMWDGDGDYVARPRDDLVVCVFGDPGDMCVAFVKWREPRPDETLSDIWWMQHTIHDINNIDDPLHAVGAIIHYLKTHPQR